MSIYKENLTEVQVMHTGTNVEFRVLCSALLHYMYCTCVARSPFVSLLLQHAINLLFQPLLVVRHVGVGGRLLPVEGKKKIYADH